MAHIDEIVLPVRADVRPLEFEYLVRIPRDAEDYYGELEKLLNKLGAEGWRLTHYSDDGQVCIFERIKQHGAAPPGRKPPDSAGEWARGAL